MAFLAIFRTAVKPSRCAFHASLKPGAHILVRPRDTCVAPVATRSTHASPTRRPTHAWSSKLHDKPRYSIPPLRVFAWCMTWVTLTIGKCGSCEAKPHLMTSLHYCWRCLANRCSMKRNGCREKWEIVGVLAYQSGLHLDIESQSSRCALTSFHWQF